MMCQNIKYVDYIKSKWYLGSFGVIAATLIAVPIYGYFELVFFSRTKCKMFVGVPTRYDANFVWFIDSEIR